MTDNSTPVPRRDLDWLSEDAPLLRESLDGGRIFVTGGTGFVGVWLLASLACLVDEYGVDASADVLTRDPARFRERHPALAAHQAIRLIQGDVRSADLTQARKATHVIIGAADVDGAASGGSRAEALDAIVTGTRRCLELASASGARRVLLVSSGAVYGTPPQELELIPEDYVGVVDPLEPKSFYAEGKRAAENMAAIWHAERSLSVSVARGFAFVGPHLRLDGNFAIGNMIGDALAGREIVVRGDGTAVRSYLYAGELARWLWTVLIRGAPARAYNVGSDQPVDIATLARLVAREAGSRSEVRIMGGASTGRGASRYVPSVRRVRDELGLTQRVSLEESVRRTLAWHRHRGGRASGTSG